MVFVIAARKLQALVRETKKKEARRGLPPGEATDLADDDEEEEVKEPPKADPPLRGDAAVVAKMAAKIKDGKGDAVLFKLVKPFKDSDEDELPVAVEDDRLWVRALNAVRKNWAEHADPWAVVAHVYDELGGSLT